MNLTQAYWSVAGKESESKRAEARPQFTSMNLTQAYWSVLGKESENKRAEFKHSWRDAVAMIYSMHKAILLCKRQKLSLKKCNFGGLCTILSEGR